MTSGLLEYRRVYILETYSSENILRINYLTMEKRTQAVYIFVLLYI